MTRSRRAASLLVTALLVPGPLWAHDFWIEPSTFRPAPGERVTLQLRVGQRVVGDALPRDPGRLVRFVALDAGGERPVPGVAGTEPAGILEAGGGGAVLVGYEGRGAVAALTPEAMAHYVEEEGLATQLPEGWRPRAATDAFSRSAKALVAVGGSAAGFDRRLGLPLELVPEVDPTALGGGGELPVVLLERGRPVAGVTVTALSWDDPVHPVRAVTDRDGRALLRLSRGGAWLVKAVRFTAAPVGAAENYRSVWASLTFETPDGGER
jgi:hypothetical protein